MMNIGVEVPPISSSGPSNYLVSSMRGFKLPASSTPTSQLPQELSSLFAEIAQRGTGKRVKDWKQHLSLLREVTVYLCPRDMLPIEVAEAILSTLRAGTTDGQEATDIGRKLYRSSALILCDILIKYRRLQFDIDATADLSNRLQKLLLELFQMAYKDIDKVDDTLGSKTFYSWRLLGIIGSKSTSEELVVSLAQTVTDRLKALPFPEKKKTSLFSTGGSAGRYEKKLHQWTALFSCLHRIRSAPSNDLLESVYMACASSHAALARHALAVLKMSAKVAPAQIARGIVARLREESQLLNFSDSLCVNAVFGVCQTIVEYQHVDPVNCSDDILANMYEAIVKLLNSRSSKTSLEALKFVLSIPRAWSFAIDILSRGTSVAEECSRTLLRLLTIPAPDVKRNVTRQSSVALSSGEPLGGGGGRLQVESILFPAVMRACRQLGKFLVARPEDVNLLIATNKKLTAAARRPSLDDPKKAADLLLDFDFELPAAASYGPNGSDSSVSIDDNVAYVDAILKPVGKLLLSMLTQLRQRDLPPIHALSEILTAIIWVAPDPLSDTLSGAVRQEDLWLWVQEQLLDSLPIFGSDLCINMIRTLTSRLHDSRCGAFLAISRLLLIYTHKACSYYPCVDVCNHLSLVWEAVNDANKIIYNPASALSTILRHTLLEYVVHSARGLPDPAVLPCKSFAPYGRFYDDDALTVGECQLQIIREIKLSAILFLGEHAIALAADGSFAASFQPAHDSQVHTALMMPTHLGISQIKATNCLDKSEFKNLSGVLIFFINILWTEPSCYRNASLKALTKIAIKITNMNNPTDSALGVVTFISRQLNSFAISITNQGCNSELSCGMETPRLRASIMSTLEVINSFVAKLSPAFEENITKNDTETAALKLLLHVKPNALPISIETVRKKNGGFKSLSKATVSVPSSAPPSVPPSYHSLQKMAQLTSDKKEVQRETQNPPSVPVVSQTSIPLASSSILSPWDSGVDISTPSVSFNPQEDKTAEASARRTSTGGVFFLPQQDLWNATETTVLEAFDPKNMEVQATPKGAGEIFNIDGTRSIPSLSQPISSPWQSVNVDPFSPATTNPSLLSSLTAGNSTWTTSIEKPPTGPKSASFMSPWSEDPFGRHDPFALQTAKDTNPWSTNALSTRIILPPPPLQLPRQQEKQQLQEIWPPTAQSPNNFGSIDVFSTTSTVASEARNFPQQQQEKQTPDPFAFSSSSFDVGSISIAGATSFASSGYSIDPFTTPSSSRPYYTEHSMQQQYPQQSQPIQSIQQVPIQYSESFVAYSYQQPHQMQPLSYGQQQQLPATTLLPPLSDDPFKDFV